MGNYINNFDDVMDFLDNLTEGIHWDTFYELRDRPANFILQNELPDENLVELFNNGLSISSAIEFGCGEGRNAIFMAKQGVSVTGIDISNKAIQNAQTIASRKGVRVDFRCQDAIKEPITGCYDLAYDSGMLHHIAPHRRITYIKLLKSILKNDGYFALNCFAWGDECADEIDDWEFYQQRRRFGVAFTKERLISLFSPHFEVINIRKCRSGIPGTIQGLDFMWTCLFKNIS